MRNKNYFAACISELDFSRKNLRDFGRVIFLCLSLLGLILFLRHKPGFKPVLFTGCLFLLFAQIRPLLLKTVYLVWMIIAFSLGWVNTRLILFIIYYIVITPIGLLARAFGKDFLDLRYDSNIQTYCVKKIRQDDTKQRCEKTF